MVQPVSIIVPAVCHKRMDRSNKIGGSGIGRARAILRFAPVVAKPIARRPFDDLMLNFQASWRESVCMVVILMGVSGSGESTVGQILARRLGWLFYDGDNFHSMPNRDKMRRGEPLTDRDRLPWLNALRELIERCLRNHLDAVLACSALKRSYRDLIVPDTRAVHLVYLKGSSELIAQRIAARHGHFFNPELLRSQFEALEEPSAATVVDISGPPEPIADTIIARLQLPTPRLH